MTRLFAPEKPDKGPHRLFRLFERATLLPGGSITAGERPDAVLLPCDGAALHLDDEKALG